MFEPYTQKARRVIFFARYEASQFGSPCIDTEHLLLGILREDSAIAKRLSRLSLTIEFLRRRIEEQIPPRGRVPTSIDMPLSAGCKRVLAYAAEEAERLGDKHIGTSYLLLGLLKEKDGLAAKVLSEAEIDTSEFRDEIGRMSDTTWKVAQPQKSRLEDYIEIHGSCGAQIRFVRWANTTGSFIGRSASGSPAMRCSTAQPQVFTFFQGNPLTLRRPIS